MNTSTKSFRTVHTFKDIPANTKGFPVQNETVARTIQKLGGYTQVWYLHQNHLQKFMYVWMTEWNEKHAQRHA